MKLGSHGELVPIRGFSRDARHRPLMLPHMTAWRSHDGLKVISSLERAHLPGSGDPPQVGPQWLVTVSFQGRDQRPTAEHVERVVSGFDMPAWDEDNHHPGVARHLWCPVDEQYRSACECKLTEKTLTEADGYRWTTDLGECRGCEYQRLMGPEAAPCPIHAQVKA